MRQASADVVAAVDELDAARLANISRAAATCLDDDGQPLLVRAIFASDPKRPDESLAVIRALLGAGANPAQADGDGASALHVAASKLTLEPAFATAAFARVVTVARVD